MDDQAVRPLHALLIGIDRYERNPLSGCVNDVEDFARFLTQKLGVPDGSIRKLVAPSAAAPCTSRPGEAGPTHAAIVAALKALASSPVQRGDRVLVYYSGHGSFDWIPEGRAYFEGLAPLDVDQHGLLLDIELNPLLQAIAQQCHDLTVILDCCHSAGATRDTLEPLPGSRARFLPMQRDAAASPSRNAAQLAQLTLGQTPKEAQELYTVVAACHADEKAQECDFPPGSGLARGLFSRCLLELLHHLEPEALTRLRWSDIWERLKAEVLRLNPSQRPQLLGPPERRLFGGPWQPQDPGYAIAAGEDGSYTIQAGSLAGIGTGADIGVYGPEPARFPPLGSEADERARRGVLVVESVTLAQSSARPKIPGTTLELGGARGRLLTPGNLERLRVAICDSVDPQIRGALMKLQSHDRFVVLPESDTTAEAHVGQFSDGNLWIGDELYAPSDPSSPGPIARIERARAIDTADLTAGLRAGLNHYAQYVIPLRLYRNGSFTLPQHKLEVRWLDCNGMEAPQRMEQDASLRCEVRKDSSGKYYRCQVDDRIAIEVTNTQAMLGLFVSLLLCSMEGQIQLLDTDVYVKTCSSKLFWLESFEGNAFVMDCPESRSWGIDRLVVIATDQKGMDLHVLNQEQTLAQAIDSAMGTKSVQHAQTRGPRRPRWTAAQVLVRVDRPE